MVWFDSYGRCPITTNQAACQWYLHYSVFICRFGDFFFLFLCHLNQFQLLFLMNYGSKNKFINKLGPYQSPNNFFLERLKVQHFRDCYCSIDLSRFQASVQHPVLPPGLLDAGQVSGWRRRLLTHQRWRGTASISDEFARVITCQIHFLCILFPYLHPHGTPVIPASTLGIVSPQCLSIWRRTASVAGVILHVERSAASETGMGVRFLLSAI